MQFAIRNRNFSSNRPAPQAPGRRIVTHSPGCGTGSAAGSARTPGAGRRSAAYRGVAAIRPEVRQEPGHQSEQRRVGARTVDRLDAVRIGEVAQHGRGDARDAERESEEEARHEAQLAGQQLLGVEQDRRKGRGEHEAGAECRHGRECKAAMGHGEAEGRRAENRNPDHGFAAPAVADRTADQRADGRGEEEDEEEEEEDEDSEPIEVITPAMYYLKNGKHYVVYDEVLEGLPGITKNKIRIAGDNLLEIKKSGHTNTQMVFEKDKINMTQYETPYGEFMIGIFTKSMMVDVTEKNIDVLVNYELDINSEKIADCNIRMNIRANAPA